MALSAKSIRTIPPEKLPSVLLFCSTEEMDGFLAGPLSQERKVFAAAELFLRYFFNPAAEIKAILDRTFTHRESDNFHAIFHDIFPVAGANQIPACLWSTDDPFSSACEIILRKQLTELFSEDDTGGFIPVYSPDGSGYLIPFHFTERKNEMDDAPAVYDLDGRLVENWLENYRKTILPLSDSDCVIHCQQELLPFPLSGPSFMLPLYLAAKRKFSPGFPQYNRFRLLATGEISGNRLIPVKTAEKAAAVRNSFPDAVFLYPENIEFSTNPAMIRLSCSAGLPEVMEQVCRIIEAHSLIIPDYSYAMRRLKKIEEETRHDNHSRWDFMLKRLETNAAAINEFRDPELYLLCLMLKSSICCHMGDTPKALEWNHKAKDFAAENHFEKQLLHLEVEELIDFQDLEDFDSIQYLLDKQNLADNIEQFGDDDLRMRFYGSMGQVQAYGFLSGIEGFSKEESLAFFRKAVQCACRMNSDEDIAQDLNYLHLWHALFDHGSPAEQKAWLDASNHIRCQLRNQPERQKKNDYFLRRQRAFALYRRLLRDKAVFPDFRDLRLPAGLADDWLFAITNKYIGALAAASGDRNGAKKEFDEALDVFKESRNPILRLIRMTILAEAWRSLRDDSYKEQALKALESLQTRYPRQTEKWRSFLLGTAPFPGLEYWY